MLHAGDFLTDEERDVLRWGGNAKVTVPQRFSKSGAHAVTYKRATALECLVRAIGCKTCVFASVSILRLCPAV